MDLPACRLFGAPHRYHQGPGAVDLLGSVLAPFGLAPLLVADAFVLQMLGDRLVASCRAAGLHPLLRAFDGEITYPAIDALIGSLGGAAPGIVAGIGGGDRGRQVAGRGQGGGAEAAVAGGDSAHHRVERQPHQCRHRDV